MYIILRVRTCGCFGVGGCCTERDRVRCGENLGMILGGFVDASREDLFLQSEAGEM
jgi:hypothetical protein